MDLAALNVKGPNQHETFSTDVSSLLQPRNRQNRMFLVQDGQPNETIRGGDCGRYFRASLEYLKSRDDRLAASFALSEARRQQIR